jgi:hypothetical protein
VSFGWRMKYNRMVEDILPKPKTNENTNKTKKERKERGSVCVWISRTILATNVFSSLFSSAVRFIPSLEFHLFHCV